MSAEGLANDKERITLATAVSPGPKASPAKLIEATLGRLVDAAVFATQSTPEILQVNVKPCVWVDP